MSSIAASGDTALPARTAGRGTALRSRILSALVLAPLVLVGIFFGYPLFDVLIALMGAVMVAEWRRLAGGKVVDAVGLSMIAGLIAVIVSVQVLGIRMGLGIGPPLVLLGSAALVAGVSWSTDRRHDVRIACVFGMVFIGACAMALVWLRSVEATGLAIIVWLFVAIWMTDSFAYFTGRAIGGPRLAPRISPNKTWAGLAGGMAAAAIWSTAAGLWLGTADRVGLSAVAAAGAGTALLAQIGDLGVSVLKRHFGAKDAGTIIPGHGGVLDRMDGFLTAAPAVALAIAVSGSGGMPWQ